jgi:type I restriction enzyme S subunit
MEGGRVNQHVCILRPTDELLPHFLSYYLRSPDQQALVGSNQVGGTRQAVTKAMLLEWKIALPPVSEQDRIVRLLDEAEELRKLRTKSGRRSADLIPALFNEMFGDSGTNPKGWPIRHLGELVELGSGATPSKENTTFWTGTTPWVSPKDMKAEEITDAEDHVSTAAFEKTNLQLIPKDTVLIVVRGMILANTVPIRICRLAVAINQDMKALLPKQQVQPEFLRWSLQSQHAHLLNRVSTAGHGTKKLDSERLREVTIPHPPLALQKEFAERVTEIRGLEAEQGASRGRLDSLFRSMLRRAFNEEL